MYVFAVVFLMFIFPIISIGIELIVNKNAVPLIDLIGKWFVFWAIGVRLFTAGLRQIIKPALTSEGILGIKTKEAWQLVRELGFANVAIGLMGIISLWITGWQTASALVGGLFLFLAGIEHLPKKSRGFEENLAMYSDLFIGVLMVTYLIIRL
jgi:hypothetical protein